MLTYGPGARVSNKRGPWGSFLIEFVNNQPCWVYYEMHNDQRVVLGPNLRNAEVAISKRYLASLRSGVVSEAAVSGQRQAVAMHQGDYEYVTQRDGAVQDVRQKQSNRGVMALM